MAEYAQQVQNAGDLDKILSTKEAVLVDFWAPWCGPCKMMGPVVDDLAKKYEGKVFVVKVNVDEASDLAAKYNVSSIPMFVMFKSGKIVHTNVGTTTRQELDKQVTTYLLS